jgi:hypothetical protein
LQSSISTAHVISFPWILQQRNPMSVVPTSERHDMQSVWVILSHVRHKRESVEHSGF